jgi:hypothetical protein
MKTITPKTCVICHCLFYPDPRVGDRQQVCKNIKCQQERKRLAQKRWLAANPDYFKGRYPELKEKIRANQRTKRLLKQQQKSYDIQDELSVLENRVLSSLKSAITIQDEITLKFTVIQNSLRQAFELLYKTSYDNVFA